MNTAAAPLGHASFSIGALPVPPVIRAKAGAAEVSIIQNRPTLVVSLKEAQAPYALYDEPIPFEDLDLLAASFPFPIYRRSHQAITKKNAEADKPLLDGLRAKGFKLTSGPDGSGWQIMYGNRGGGYYFDAGCSQMIVDGRVGLLQYDDIERFCADGALMKDGSVRQADLIVLATGYKGQKEAVRGILGDEITDRIGPVWGFDDGGRLPGRRFRRSRGGDPQRSRCARAGPPHRHP